MSAIDENIRNSGIHFGEPPKPGGSYVAVNIRANIAYVAIQLPIKDGAFLHIGKLGQEVSVEDGYEAAKMAAMNVLSQINTFVGFERLVGLNHADIYYRAGEGFEQAPRVADGASDLFLSVLGDLGKHTRAIFGVDTLPRGFCVGLTTSFTIKS